MKIRRATEKDFEIICEFIDKIDDFEAALTPILSNSKEQRAAIRKEVKGNLKNPKIQTFIAEVDGKAVGTVNVKYRDKVRPKFTRRKVGIIDHLFVLESFRKRGIATKLVEAAKEWLRSKGIDWFEAYLSVKNKASFNVFKKTKFEPYAYIMHCYE